MRNQMLPAAVTGYDGDGRFSVSFKMGTCGMAAMADKAITEAECLKLLKAKSGIDDATLAPLLGITSRTLENLRGGRKTSLDVQIKLASFLQARAKGARAKRRGGAK